MIRREIPLPSKEERKEMMTTMTTQLPNLFRKEWMQAV
jgi:hypothetical protein